MTWVAAHNYAPDRAGRLQRERASSRPERLDAALDGHRRGRSPGWRWSGRRADELERARTLVRARWARRLESMEGRASALAAAEALEDVGLLDREYALLAEIDPAQVREAAARHLAPDAVVGVAYLPADAGSGPHRRRARPAPSRSPSCAPSANGGGRRAARGVPPRRARATQEHGVSVTRLPGRRPAGLPQGRRAARQPRASTCRGRRFDPPAQAGLGSLLVRAAVRGAGDLDAAALAFAFERLGGTLATSSAVRLARASAPRCSSEHLPRGGRAARHRLLAIRTSRDADIAAERGLMIAEAEQVADDMFRYPFQLAFAAAFGERGVRAPGRRAARDAAGHRPRPTSAPGTRRRWLGVRPVVHRGGRRGPGARVGRAGRRLRRRARRSRPPRRAGARRLDARRGARSRRSGWYRATRRRRRSRWRSPARRGATADHAAAQVWGAVASGLGRPAVRGAAGPPVAGLHRRSPRRGRRPGAAPSSPTSRRHPSGRTRRGEQMLVELERFTREPVREAELRQAVNYLAGQARGQPAERRGGGGRDPRGLVRRVRSRRSWTIRPRRSARSQRRTSCGSRPSRSTRTQGGRGGAGTGAARSGARRSRVTLRPEGSTSVAITSRRATRPPASRATTSTRQIPSSGIV